MSDVMLIGVLRMPYEMAMGSTLSQMQYHSRGLEAAERILADEARIAELEADRDKWRNECLAANESERKLFQRQAELEAEVIEAEQRGYAKAMEAERLLYDYSLNIVWNDAIEAAAKEIDCGGQCGACGSHGHCYSELAATIYSLRR